MRELSEQEHGLVGQWHLERAVLMVLRKADGWCTARQVSTAAGLYWSEHENFRLAHTLLNKLCHEGWVEYRRKDRYRIMSDRLWLLD